MNASHLPRRIGPWFVVIELHTLPWDVRDIIFAGEAPVAPSSYTLQSAVDLGCRTAVLSSAPSDYEGDFDALVDRWLTVDTRSVSACLEAIRVLDGPVVVVTSSIDNFVGISSRVAEALDLPGPDPRGAAMARDKSAVRTALCTSGLRNARWAAADIDEALTTSPIGYPCVVKPVDGAAGWDVRLVHDDDELRSLCSTHLAREYGRGVRPRRRLVFEEHLGGQLVSCEGFVDRAGPVIFGYSDRVLGPLPSFVEIAVRFGAETIDDRVDSYVEDCLASTGYTYGAFHLEMMVGPDGVTLVELNARLVGGGVQQAMSAIGSAPVSDFCVGAMLGLRSAPPTFDGAATQVQLFSDTSGRLLHTSGVEEASTVPGCLSVGALSGTGRHVVGPPESNSDAIGYVHAVGRGREDSYSTALAAAEHLSFGMAPPGAEVTRGS